MSIDMNPMKATKILAWAVILAWVIFSASLGAQLANANAGYSAGNFDSYVLAVSWEPEFCRLHKDTLECSTQTADRFDAKNLVLHGLWPNKNGDLEHKYGYCNVDNNLHQLDKNHFWDKLPASDISAETKEMLSKYMPGYASYLDRHEWHKHGTCSSLDADEFFRISAALTKQMTKTSFNKFISDHIGQTIDSNDLLNEFEKEFGPESRKYVSLNCYDKQDTSRLSEVHISLSKDLSKDPVLKNVLKSFDEPEKTTCSQNIYISPVSLRTDSLTSTTSIASPDTLVAPLFSSSPWPLVAKGQPVDWWFVYKFNAADFPGCKGNAQRTCLFGGTVQDADKYSQQYVYASSAAPYLREGDGCVGDTLKDPVGATFAQVYNNPALYYVIWNDQFHGDPKADFPSPWGHLKGILAWNDQGEGFVMQVSTPSWPRSASELDEFNMGNTLGCVMKPSNILVSQHFFALKLNKEDLVKVLAGMQNASVPTDPQNKQIVRNGGPADIQTLVNQLGKRSPSTQYQKTTLSSDVQLISKPSALWVPPWQFVSAALGGVSLRVATWSGKNDILSTTSSTEINCWRTDLGKPASVEVATTGKWAEKNIKLGKGASHAKFGVSAIDSSKPYTIFGDLNQEGSLSGNCGRAQNGRGGLFFVVNNKSLFDSVSKLLEGESAPVVH